MANPAIPLLTFRSTFPAKRASPDIAAAKAVREEELDRRMLSLRTDPEYCQRLISASKQGADERDPWPHVEQQIHDAFIPDADERLSDAFHATPWEERLGLLDALEDARLKQLGRRLVFLERPDVLPDHVRQKMTIALAKRLIDGDAREPGCACNERFKKQTT